MFIVLSWAVLKKIFVTILDAYQYNYLQIFVKHQQGGTVHWNIVHIHHKILQFV